MAKRNSGRTAATGRSGALSLLVAGLMINACGKKSDSNPSNEGSNAGTLSLELTAQGVNSVLEGSALRLTDVASENFGYPGIGMSFGDSVVEGMKLKVLAVSLQTVNEETGGWGNSVPLVDFGPDGKELEISEGFNGKIEVSENVTIPVGTYSQVSVSVQNAFSLKAYAYLDRDNDGAIDATIWTTASEVKMETEKLAPGSMPGYDWYAYPWLVASVADSLTDNSAKPAEHTTVLSEPIVITEEGVATEGDPRKSISVSLLIDTFRIIKVWDGRYGNGTVWTPGDGDTTHIPFAEFPFPKDDTDSRKLGNSGLTTNDFFPEGKPAFALGNYLSVFGFINKTGVKAQNYLISKTETISPYTTQVFTLILDGDGTPLFAKSGLGESDQTLHIGPYARGFEKQDDSTYTFGTAYGMKDENGKWDGGLYRSDDMAKAGHLFSEFRKLTVGQRGEMTMKNGPRCHDEYDYCVADEGVTAYYLRAQ